MVLTIYETYYQTIKQRRLTLLLFLVSIVCEGLVSMNLKMVFKIKILLILVICFSFYTLCSQRIPNLIITSVNELINYLNGLYNALLPPCFEPMSR